MMKIKNIINENYDMEEDEYTRSRLADSRRPRLTLRHINKLRKLKDVRRLETAERAEFVKRMYATNTESEGGF